MKELKLSNMDYVITDEMAARFKKAAPCGYGASFYEGQAVEAELGLKSKVISIDRFVRDWDLLKAIAEVPAGVVIIFDDFQRGLKEIQLAVLSYMERDFNCRVLYRENSYSPIEIVDRPLTFRELIRQHQEGASQ